MQYALILSALTGAVTAATLAGAPVHEFACGAPGRTYAQSMAAKDMAIAEAAAVGTLQVRAPISVKAYIHIVGSSQAKVDAISTTAINNQIKVLNDNYAPSSISFTLAGTDKTVNGRWATDQDEMAMKSKLRKGTYADLNLYFVEDMGDNLGYCYFPDKKTSSTVTRDGCTIRLDTLPGNSGPFGLGKTATHEVGHWFGLEHTFNGGCTGDGDFVDDTPAQASASSGCPAGRDSCPDQPGLDPIHNYMDYSSDACYEEFTKGQTTRMTSMWNKYRKGQ